MINCLSEGLLQFDLPYEMQIKKENRNQIANLFAPIAFYDIVLYNQQQKSATTNFKRNLMSYMTPTLHTVDNF